MFVRIGKECVLWSCPHGIESIQPVPCVGPLGSPGEVFDGGSCLAVDGLVQGVSPQSQVHQGWHTKTYVEFPVAKLPSSMGLKIQTPEAIPGYYKCKQSAGEPRSR